jgi:predicted small secreted protein
MKRTILIPIALFALSVLVLGCATITKGTSQQISITSNVDGATLYLDGSVIGTTPYYGEVPKNKMELKVEKEGYRTATIVLSKTLEGMFWGNIILGGTIGSITDFASGGAYAYAPATYQVDLKADTQSALEFEQEYAVRMFSMIYIDEISRDLAVGEGEYLSSLVELMERQDCFPEAVAGVRQALESCMGQQAKFGNAVVALL